MSLSHDVIHDIIYVTAVRGIAVRDIAVHDIVVHDIAVHDTDNMLLEGCVQEGCLLGSLVSVPLELIAGLLP